MGTELADGLGESTVLTSPRAPQSMHQSMMMEGRTAAGGGRLDRSAQFSGRSAWEDMSLVREEDEKRAMEANIGDGPHYLGRGKIRHPAFIPMLFELVCQGSDTQLQETLVRDTLWLLQKAASNRDAFLHSCSSSSSSSRMNAPSWRWKVRTQRTHTTPSHFTPHPLTRYNCHIIIIRTITASITSRYVRLHHYT